MQAGPLRHRVQIQARSATRGTHGGTVETWTPQATRWAAVEPLQGRDLLAAAQIDPRLTHRVAMRYYAGLTPTRGETGGHRIVWGERVFTIMQARNIQERDRMTEALCIEEV
jgi:SPP1 family predicted phage head-tail adaptor